MLTGDRVVQTSDWRPVLVVAARRKDHQQNRRRDGGNRPNHSAQIQRSGASRPVVRSAVTSNRSGQLDRLFRFRPSQRLDLLHHAGGEPFVQPVGRQQGQPPLQRTQPLEQPSLTLVLFHPLLDRNSFGVGQFVVDIGADQLVVAGLGGGAVRTFQRGGLDRGRYSHRGFVAQPVAVQTSKPIAQRTQRLVLLPNLGILIEHLLDVPALPVGKLSIEVSAQQLFFEKLALPVHGTISDSSSRSLDSRPMRSRNAARKFTAIESTTPQFNKIGRASSVRRHGNPRLI